jgi:D-alanyl-lipoteichoic acid acyltransferase DltB (MBOAT superfamily)
MLFNSYEFILAFLPVAVVTFFLVARTSRTWALRWLMLVSLFFYAWWRPFNVAIIAPSILVNFALVRAMLSLNREGNRRAAKIILGVGILFNVAFLGYFKYANFVATASNDVLGTDIVLTQIILPLGISFITFQKIALLVDAYGGRVESLTFQEYCLFVLFFPQLIAGPIVHYREIVPQFRSLSCMLNGENVAVGTTLLVFGLFKKVVLADGIAPMVTGIFDQASAGTAMSLLPAWMAAFGFTLQIYFDFSGYTDMALGSARLFGMRLPPNFDSPLRASSIIEFWSRWHMTLTRFLTAYIYNPLLLLLTRRRLAKGRAGYGARPGVGAFVELLAFPTLLTMSISGIWHGAGYLFILWGVLHGVFIVVNHAWRQIAAAWWRGRRLVHPWVTRPAAIALTVLCVVASMVLFRSPTLDAATALYQGMFGMRGVALPERIFASLGPLTPFLERAGITPGLGFDLPFFRLAAWLIMLALIAFACPNTLRILSLFKPALRWESSLRYPALAWQPSLAWAVAVAVVAAASVTRLGGQSEFLYWQF